MGVQELAALALHYLLLDIQQLREGFGYRHGYFLLAIILPRGWMTTLHSREQFPLTPHPTTFLPTTQVRIKRLHPLEEASHSSADIQPVSKEASKAVHHLTTDTHKKKAIVNESVQPQQAVKMGVSIGNRILRKIVKNEAMAEDPPEIYGWRVYLLACSACFGAMSFGWDSSVIGGVIELEPFKHDFGFIGNDKAKANLGANIVSTLQAGCFLGALIASPITDRFGRKWCLIAVSLVVISGIIMQAAASGNLAPMYVGRFVAGVGVGAASCINPVFVSENAPRSIRGLLTGLYQLFIVTGGMIAFWINYSVSLHFKGKFMYIFPLAIQALPAGLLCVCMLLCHESPRWLARRDRWEECKSVLARIRNLSPDHPYIIAEFREIQDQLEQERRLQGDATYWDLTRDLWTVAGNRKRALISIFLMICQQMTGTNAINTYAPTIFKNLGITGTSTSLFSTGIYGIVKVISCLVFLLFLADSLGRRRSLLWTSIAQGLAMFYIGLYVRISPPIDGQPVPPAGYVALVCIFLFAAFFQFGWGPACWIYASEIPAARLRSLNVSYAAATQWLFNFVVARAVPTMLVTVGEHGYGTYLIFGSFCFSMFVFVWFFVPETKGISLEHMDELFGVTDGPAAEKSSVQGGDDIGSEIGKGDQQSKHVEGFV